MFGSMFSPKKRPVVLRLDKRGDPQIVGRVKERYLKDLLYQGFLERTELVLENGETVNGFKCVRSCELGIPDEAEISLIIHVGDTIMQHSDAVMEK